MKATRVAVAGYGYWGPMIVRSLREIEEVELVACCDPLPHARQRLRRAHPDVPAYCGVPEALQQSGAEALVLATPIDSHYALARCALEQGVHVLVEKPLCLASEQGRELRELSQKKGAVLGVGHTFVYNPAVVALRSALQRGVLGTVRAVSSQRLNRDTRLQPWGVLWDLAVHDISILQYWFQQTPSHVYVYGNTGGSGTVPVIAFIMMQFGAGVIANVEVSWAAPVKTRRIQVSASRATAVLDDTQALERLRFYPAYPNIVDAQRFHPSLGGFHASSPVLERGEPLELELRDFINAVRGGTALRSDATFGISVVETLERLQRSWEQNCSPMKPVLAAPLEITQSPHFKSVGAGGANEP